MSSDTPDTPAFQGGKTKFGDRTMSSTYKEGNDVVTQYNPTDSEKSAYDYLESALPGLYKNATSGQNFDDYTKAYTDNQKQLVNDDYTKGLNIFKGAMTTSGQMKDSSSMDKLRPMETSYLNSMQNIEANAPTYAQQLRSNDSAYNSGLLQNAVNGINNFYNTGNTFNGAANTLSNMGNSDSQNQFSDNMQSYAAKQAQMNQYLNSGSGGGGSNADMAMMFL